MFLQLKWGIELFIDYDMVSEPMAQLKIARHES